MEVMVPLAAGDFSFDITDSVHLSPLSQPSNYNHDHDCIKKYSFNEEFMFSTRGALDLPPLPSADELFDSGKIKPCEPNHKKIIQNNLSFGRKSKVYSKHFTIAKKDTKDTSLSSSSSVGWTNKKWRLKDLLFRSASEGHETNKYSYLGKLKEEDIRKNSSAKKKRNAKTVVALSAHERHYKVRRAATEEMRKRTYLPYKQNLMIGCMDLAAAGVREPSRVASRIR